MEFKSRRDILFTIFTFALLLLLLVVFALAITELPPDPDVQTLLTLCWPTLLLTGTIVLLVYNFFFTRYELTNRYFIYKSGFISGKIKISSIREIIIGKYLWSGMRPATASKGIIIRYEKYEQIYISPDTNDTFIAELLKLKPDIIITDLRKQS